MATASTVPRRARGGAPRLLPRAQMFLWTTPYGMKTFGRRARRWSDEGPRRQTRASTTASSPPGLAWSLCADAVLVSPLRIFFFACVVVAGVYGGATAFEEDPVHPGGPRRARPRGDLPRALNVREATAEPPRRMRPEGDRSLETDSPFDLGGLGASAVSSLPLRPRRPRLARPRDRALNAPAAHMCAHAASRRVRGRDARAVLPRFFARGVPGV